MLLPKAIQTAATDLLSAKLSHVFEVRGFRPVSGGCINAAGRLDTNEGPFFIKWNHADLYPGMFAAEMAGLAALRAPNVLHVPAVIGVGRAGDEAFLLMEWVEAGPKQRDFYTQFGASLAALHRQTTDAFGFEADNYIGSLAQSNKWRSDWTTFMVEERLLPQLILAIDGRYITAAIRKQCEHLFKVLPDLLPESAPSLLHGDLWNGNYLVGPGGEPSLVDPAVYYGHREMELAYTKMFGGFPTAFYDSYAAAWPLEPGFNNRVPLYQLYPLLVHVNLFGNSYVPAVRQVVQAFG